MFAILHILGKLINAKELPASLIAYGRRLAGYGEDRAANLADGIDIEICVQSGLFDEAWYLMRNPESQDTTAGALTHYLRTGARLGFDPNPLFHTKWYVRQNPELGQDGGNPLVHYIRTGANAGRDPSPLFDSDWYMERNPDVASAGANPLGHYLTWGAAEGRVRRPRPRPLQPLPRSPRVSAIVPCWNGARWLAEALKSIMAQAYPVYEIIVVDDASTDGSGEIARQFPATVLRNDTNLGEGHSRNVGLRHSSGDLIAWLDADDFWLPHHVGTLVGLLQSYPTAAGAFAAVQRFGRRDELIRGYVPLGKPAHVYWQALTDWLHTTIGSVTYRSVLLDVGGFDETERYSVDFDLWVRLARSHLFVSTHEVTSMWRWHEAQQSAQWAEQLRAVYRYRQRYLAQEIAVGDFAFAGAMRCRIAEILRQDLRDAEGNADDLVVRVLDDVKPWIFGNQFEAGSGFIHGQE